MWLLAALSSPLHALPLVFDGGGLDNRWNNASNWEPDVVPGLGDDVDVGNFNTELDASFSINSLRVGPTGSTQLGANRLLVLHADSHVDGRLVLADDNPGASFGNLARLRLDGGPVSLGGSGSIEFATAFQNVIDATGGASLTIGAGLTVTTTGTDSVGSIAVDLANAGVISANAGSIGLSGASQSNTGTLQALNGGTLQLAGSLDNSGGLLNIAAGAKIGVANGGGVIGGVIGGAGTFDPTGVVTLDSLSLDGVQVAVDNNDLLAFGAGVINNATIVLNDRDASATFGNLAKLQLAAGSLAGNGEIQFVTEHQNIVSSTGLAVLTPDQTLRTVGAGSHGTISANLENNGLITTVGGRLTLSGQDKINNTLIEAAGGATLDVIDGVDITQGSTGVLRVDATSALHLNDGVSIVGGRIEGGGVVNVSGPLVTIGRGGATPDSTVLHDLTVNLVQNNLLLLRGTVTNNSTVVLADADAGATFGNNATVRLDGAVIDGNGEILFASEHQNHVDSIGQATLGSGQRLRTIGPGSAGDVRAQLVNLGSIEADGGRIDLSAGVKDNRNLIAATNGGTLRLVNTRIEQTAAGRVHVEAGSRLELHDGATLRGGHVFGGGDVVQTGAGLVRIEGGASGIHLDGLILTVNEHQTLLLSGKVTNNGTIRLDDRLADGSFGNFATLAAADAVTIDGSGEIVIGSTFDNRLVGGSLVLGAQQTLRLDAGTRAVVGTAVTSHGTVLANGRLDGAASLQNAASGVVSGSGTLVAGGTFMNDGQLTAGRTVRNSIGTLRFENATVNNGDAASVLIEIAAGGGLASAGVGNDWLLTDGTFELAGLLVVELLGGFVPQVDDEFFVVQANAFAGLVDDFVNVVSGIGTFDFGTAVVEVRDNHLVLGNFQLDRVAGVPAPGTLLLVGGLLALLALRHSRAADRAAFARRTMTARFAVDGGATDD